MTVLPRIAGRFLFSLLIPCCASGYVTRIRDDNVEEPSVTDESRYEQEIVEEYNCYGSSRSALYKEVWWRIEEVVYRDHSGDDIRAVSNEANEEDWDSSCDPDIGGLMVTSRHDGGPRTAWSRCPLPGGCRSTAVAKNKIKLDCSTA
jgi:hypothetical protein